MRATSMPHWQTHSLNRVPRIISVSRFQGQLDQQRAAALAGPASSSVRPPVCWHAIAVCRLPPPAAAAAAVARGDHDDAFAFSRLSIS